MTQQKESALVIVVQARRFHRFTNDSLTVEEIEEPKVEGPLDVIVDVGGAGLCRTDIHAIEGQWAPIQDPDRTQPYVLVTENVRLGGRGGSGILIPDGAVS